MCCAAAHWQSFLALVMLAASTEETSAATEQFADTYRYYYSLASQDPLAYFTFVDSASRSSKIIQYHQDCIMLLRLRGESPSEGSARLVAGTRDWEVYRAALSAWAAAMRMWSKGLRDAAAGDGGGGSSSGSSTMSSSSGGHDSGNRDHEGDLVSYQNRLMCIIAMLGHEMPLQQLQIAGCVTSGSAVDPVLLLCRQLQLLQLVWVVRGLLLLIKVKGQMKLRAQGDTGGRHSDVSSKRTTSSSGGSGRSSSGCSGLKGSGGRGKEDAASKAEAVVPGAGETTITSKTSSSSSRGMGEERCMEQNPCSGSSSSSMVKRGRRHQQQQQKQGHQTTSQQQQQLAGVLQGDRCLASDVELVICLLEACMEATMPGAAPDKNNDTVGTAAAAAMGKPDGGPAGAGVETDTVAGRAAPAARAAVTEDLELLGLMAGPLVVAAAAPLVRGGGSGANVGNSSSKASETSGGGGYRDAVLVLMPDAVREAMARVRRVVRTQLGLSEEGGLGMSTKGRSGDLSSESEAIAAAGVQPPEGEEEEVRQQQQQLHGDKGQQEQQQQEEKEQQQKKKKKQHAQEEDRQQANGEEQQHEKAEENLAGVAKEIECTQESEADHGAAAAVEGVPAKELEYYVALVDALHVFVAEVPLPVGCNNPHCPAAVDEAVATRKCTGCKLAVYCSDGCLKEHWKEHKGVCRRVQAARKELAGNGTVCSKDVWGRL